MTSSLVGSEMCIRDRRKAIEEATPVAGPKQYKNTQRRQGSPERRQCGRTVSYTHLTLPTICSV
eukprot:1643880-Prorocentrum_lima.AAC.1